MRLFDLVTYLDEYLAISEVSDYRDAFNGLQVEGRQEVKRVAVAVDACMRTIEAAAAGSADLMLVHHGLFWGTKAPITKAYYQRVSGLIRNNIALYSCHLPLDAHPEVGNNHVLARSLGLSPGGLFSEFEGVPLGVWADEQIELSEFVERIIRLLGISPQVVPAGPETTRQIGIITGGGGSRIADAQAAGCDTFLTGEGAHHTYFEAEERSINVIYAGHYATETVGVKALAGHLEQKFGLETFFIDHPTGL